MFCARACVRAPTASFLSLTAHAARVIFCLRYVLLFAVYALFALGATVRDVAVPPPGSNLVVPNSSVPLTAAFLP